MPSEGVDVHGQGAVAGLAKVTAEVTKAVDAAGEVLVGRSVGPREALLRPWNGMPTGHLC